ncbi:GrpB family protein [Bacillus sp. DX1.1]|uniref:GrpB family protein n=1 Tax=unclassified Bacillus (in: firmicutes) TaxID=185979 RepID=UPI0025710C76|nr:MULTISPECIES: GrpB family protein [unclassified Bacillus (in: firmicutes)]MDM5155102.1 GrpB family protein [Bacillus sp. DX1.1]WJE83958.1 GrpB family protein [Bacillus sp. DX3.1]
MRITAEKTRVIEIIPYNPEWKNEFKKIKKMINGYIGDLILKIEHVGSTSVEGLAAKPIIDIDVVIDSYDIFPHIIERLAKEGYQHQGNLGVEGREAFQRIYVDGFMKYHLYVCPKDGKSYLEYIALRDYLSANETARKEYEELKYRLAERYRFDIDNYCNAKTDFVRDILNQTIYRG